MKAKKRVLCIVLVIVMALSILPSAYAAPNWDYTLTGRGIDDILAVAFAQEGKIGSEFGYYVSWCSFFPCWAGRNAKQNFPSYDLPTPQHIAQWFVNHDAGHFYCFRDGNYESLLSVGVTRPSNITRMSRENFTPQAGDIICFLWEEDLGYYNWSHAGIMAQDYDGKGILYTIEGNSFRDASPEAELETRAVRPRERPYDFTVIGVIRPVYTTAGYTVNHYLENYGGGYSLDESETIQLTRLSNAVNSVRSYDGFVSPTKEQASSAIKNDGAADLYYKRLYKLNIESESGILSVSGEGQYTSGTTVTVTAELSSDYDWTGWVSDGTVSDSLTYSFIMPASDVSLTATASPIPYIGSFRDAREDAWYAEAVKYVSDNGLMSGDGNGFFTPNSNLSRAMLAQILYNREGRPEVAPGSMFADIADEWFAPAVNWAASNGIVTGFDEGMFFPNNNITREQLAVMLWRYDGSPESETELTFADANDIGNYARPAMSWAVERGIMNGHGDGNIDPKGLATRAQVAQMLKNYLSA